MLVNLVIIPLCLSLFVMHAHKSLLQLMHMSWNALIASVTDHACFASFVCRDLLVTIYTRSRLHFEYNEKPFRSYIVLVSIFILKMVSEHTDPSLPSSMAISTKINPKSFKHVCRYN